MDSIADLSRNCYYAIHTISASLHGVILLGIVNFSKQEQPENLIYRLVWFELQVAPASYRFAIMPDQPILVGYEGENGEEGATMLINYEQVPEIFEQTIENVDALIKKNNMLSLPPINPEQAFADATMTAPSIHVRIAYADNKRWAGFYPIDNPPPALAALIQETKALAKQLIHQQNNKRIDGETAQSLLEPEKNTAQQDTPSVIIKVKVLESGKLTVNDQPISFSQLGAILDDLTTKNGGVWYFRENPEREPSPALLKIIESVLDEIAARHLPVRIQPEEG